MKSDVLNFLLIISSLFFFLEWGTENQSFLFQIEFEIFKKTITNLNTILHPFIMIPLLGQVLLFISFFQKNTVTTLTYIGIFCVGFLAISISLIGILSFNYKIFLSTLPFLYISCKNLRQIKIKK